MSPRTYVALLAGILLVPLITYIVVTPIVESPASQWQPVPETSARPAAIRGEWVLLPSNSGASCLPRGFLGAYEIWRPDSGQIAQLERDLHRILPPIEANVRTDLAERIPPLLSYRRQYIGVRLLGEPPVIYVNAFLPDEDDDRPGPYQWNWRRRLACVDDGGWGYWHVEYDPTQRRFRGFGFNGSV